MNVAQFDPTALFIMAMTNPVVVGVAFAMGTRANQWQKLIVVAFAASLAGCAAIWLASLAGLVRIEGHGAMSGLFMAQCIPGLLWGAVGYYFGRRADGAAPPKETRR